MFASKTRTLDLLAKLTAYPQCLVRHVACCAQRCAAAAAVRVLS
jgi:hypothetical protein